MTKELAKFLKNACDNSEIECEVRDDYSGRYMCGTKTEAVIVGANMSQLLFAVMRYGHPAPITKDVGLQTDSMGRSDLVIY